MVRCPAIFVPRSKDDYTTTDGIAGYNFSFSFTGASGRCSLKHVLSAAIPGESIALVAYFTHECPAFPMWISFDGGKPLQLNLPCASESDNGNPPIKRVLLEQNLASQTPGSDNHQILFVTVYNGADSFLFDYAIYGTNDQVVGAMPQGVTEVAIPPVPPVTSSSTSSTTLATSTVTTTSASVTPSGGAAIVQSPMK